MRPTGSASFEPVGDAVEVRPCPDGPLLVRGATSVRDDAGEVHEATRPVVALCRCGKSQRQPWCDATHKSIPTRI